LSTSLGVAGLPDTIHASLEAPAAVIQECAAQAMAVAEEAAADAAEINNAHAKIEDQHRKLFLPKAFGINPDGTKITNESLRCKTDATCKVKSIERYNDMIRILTDWGDNAVLAAGPLGDPAVQKIKAFRSNNREGYNYAKIYTVRETKAPDGSPKVNLVHKKSGGIVSHMLDVFDVINEAHRGRMGGHMGADKMHVNCKEHFHSPTLALCKLFIEDCVVCHEKQLEIPARKGEKKPILYSFARIP
jgi:hypothetical protein